MAELIITKLDVGVKLCLLLKMNKKMPSFALDGER